jgi:F-type H+-transporting ATPase subunit epsilon
VSPERILWQGDADMVIARTIGGGEIAFLTGHAPFVGALDIATVTVRAAEGADEVIAVHGGFVEVSNDNVTILSDVAEVASQIDVERARRAKADAEAKQRADDDSEIEARLRRAEVRLSAAGAA